MHNPSVDICDRERPTTTPIQAYLHPEQMDAIARLARRRGVSVAELIRRGAGRILADASLDEDLLWDIIGSMDSELSDLAEKYDEYVDRLINEETHY